MEAKKICLVPQPSDPPHAGFEVVEFGVAQALLWSVRASLLLKLFRVLRKKAFLGGP